jgi:DNA-binding transcriptional regulator GbsR (MarR family)
VRIDRHEVSTTAANSIRTRRASAGASLGRTRLEMIEAGGRLWQMLGLPRSTGQIYGLLYLSPRALSLDEIAGLLSISKASASTGTRQLASWHAVRQVWVPGERRDHFESVADLREVLRACYHGFFRPKLTKSQGKLAALLATLEAERKAGTVPREEYEFCRERLGSIGALQDRLLRVLPLAEKFL